MSCNNCQLKSEMWHKANTWDVENSRDCSRREYSRLDGEISNLRYRVDMLEKSLRRRDEELCVLREDIDALKNPPPPAAAVERPRPPLEDSDAD